MEIKDVVDAVASQIEEKSKAFDSQVNAVKADVETKLNEKSVEIENLKGQITVISNRANELDEMLAKKAKQENDKAPKTLGEALAQSIKEIGGGDYEKGTNEVLSALKHKAGSFSLPLNIKAVGDMTTSASLTGDPVRTYNTRQGLVPFQKVNMRDLVPTIVSPTGTFVTYRETGSEGSISTQTEGSSKSQIDYDLTEVVTVNN